MNLLIDAVATHRLARLIASDVITEAPREAFIRWTYARRADSRARRVDVVDDDWTDRALNDPDAPKLATLVVCRWCCSVWIAAVVLAARRTVPAVWDPVARLLALSSAAGLLSQLEHLEVAVDD